MKNVYKTEYILRLLDKLPEPEYKQAKFIFDKMVYWLNNGSYSEDINMSHIYWRALPYGFDTASSGDKNYTRGFAVTWGDVVGDYHCYRCVLTLSKACGLKSKIDNNSEYVILTDEEVRLLEDLK